MALQPITFDVGVSKTQTQYSAGKIRGYSAERLVSGRWNSANNIQFIAGFPEKILGWVNQTSTFPATRGVPRSVKAWRGVDGVNRLCVGASGGLYAWNGSAQTEITPFVYFGSANQYSGITIPVQTLAAPYANWIGFTPGVALPVQIGDWVYLIQGSSFEGVQVNSQTGGYVQVVATGVGNQFYVNSGQVSAAASTGTVTSLIVQLPRLTLGANPIQTFNGSSTVTLNIGTTYTPAVGDAVTIYGASAVNSITLNGTFIVTGVASPYIQVTATRSASGTGSGGGSGVVIAFNATTANAPSYLQPGWTLAPYGGLMSVCCIGGTLYFHDPVAGGRAYPIVNAPTSVNAHLVTPERFIVALGTSVSPLQIAWCDQINPFQWTSLATNTANSGRTLQGGSYFVCGEPVSNGVSLILTNRAVFMMQYTGDNEVYSTPKMADNAGCLSTWGFTVSNETGYWQGDSDWWLFNGTVQPLLSDDVREYVFSNINGNAYQNKTVAGSNRANKQIVFFYTSSFATENDQYVIYQIDSQSFSVPEVANGLLNPTPWSRTAWADADLFANPYALSSAGVLYKHNYGVDADGSVLVASLQSAFFDISNGDANMAITGMIPDMQSISGSVSVNWGTQYYPGDTPTVDLTGAAITTGTQRIDIREDGKLMFVQFVCGIVGGSTGGYMRLGTPRIELTPQGTRK